MLLQIFFFSPDFHQLWGSVMSICLLTEVAMDYVSTWMGDGLSSRPAVGCVSVGISFVNSSALLVSLMTLRLR